MPVLGFAVHRSPCHSDHNGTNGGGDYNELSNEYVGGQELIELHLPNDGEHWLSIMLSSLDDGGSPDESGYVIGSDASIDGSGLTVAELLSAHDSFHFEYTGGGVNKSLNLQNLDWRRP